MTPQLSDALSLLLLLVFGTPDEVSAHNSLDWESKHHSAQLHLHRQEVFIGCEVETQ